MVNKINELFQDRIFVMSTSGSGVTGLTNTDFTKTLEKNQTSTSEVITITEDANGYYFINFTPTSIGRYSYTISNITYQPEGWYGDILIRTNSIDDNNTILDSINTKVDTLTTYTLRLLGLSQENIYIDNQSYTENLLTAARIRSYSVSGSVGTTSDVLATYTVSASYDGNANLNMYKVVKQ